jgi:hypothetical protein
MLARARAQVDDEDAAWAAAWHAGPNVRTAWPPRQANTAPTTYSGSTATSASPAMARVGDRSSCETSAAHVRRREAPTTAAA